MKTDIFFAPSPTPNMDWLAQQHVEGREVRMVTYKWQRKAVRLDQSTPKNDK